MLRRALTVAIWLGVVASGLAWAWALRGGQPPAAPVPRGAPVAAAAGDDWAPLLGAGAAAAPAQTEAVAVPAPTSLRLLGVVASGADGRGGLALIAADQGLPRVLAVGAVVEGDTVVQSVAAREVRLGPRGGPSNAVLALPPPTSFAAGGVVQAPPLRRAGDAVNDISPIVPPYTDMAAPTAAESATPGSPWSQLREAQTQGTGSPMPAAALR